MRRFPDRLHGVALIDPVVPGAAEEAGTPAQRTWGTGDAVVSGKG